MSARQYPHLFEPGQIAGLDIACRLVTAPMTRVSAGPGGVPTEMMRDYYRAYADGGFGLIVSEGTYIDRRASQGYRNQPGMTDDAQADGWRRIVEAVHGAGARMFLQLLHAGALVQHNDYVERAVAPSAVQPVGEMASNYSGEGPFGIPHALTRDEIAEIVAAFAAAAQRAVAAGFDGVEIHGANGYLLHQFFSDTMNRRDDEYGGDAVQRARLHGEVMRAVKAAVGPDKVAGMRIAQLAVNDFGNTWSGGIEDARAIFTAMKEAGADYVHANAPPAPTEVFGSGKPLAGLAKEFYGGPVIACGGLGDPALAEQLLAAEHADFCALAKAALADPAWPTKIAAGETPIAFDTGMTRPMATLENTATWRRANAA